MRMNWVLAGTAILVDATASGGVVVMFRCRASDRGCAGALVNINRGDRVGCGHGGLTMQKLSEAINQASG
jgi:hypothetical protein